MARNSLSDFASIIMDKLELDGVTTSRHVIETRIALERGIVKGAIEKSVPDDLERIERSLEEYKSMISTAPRKSGREIIQKMFEFHSLLAKASHNPPMIIFHRTILEWAERRLMSWDPPKKWQLDQYKSHKEIFEIIKKKDISRAQKMIEKHFENVMLWHQ